MAKVELIGFLCERCGHTWIPRDKEQEPRVCPKCKSPYWNRPKRPQYSIQEEKGQISNGK